MVKLQFNCLCHIKNKKHAYNHFNARVKNLGNILV